MTKKGFDPRPLFFQLSWRQIITSWITVIAFFVLLAVCILEIPKLGNVFHVSGLLKIGALAGLILGGILSWFFAKDVDDLTDRMKICTFIIVPLLILSPLLACLLNRVGSDGGKMEKFEIFEVEKIGVSEKNQNTNLKMGDYFLYIFHESELEKVRFNDLIVAPEKGEEIEINIRKGWFGWEWVDHIFAAQNE